MFTKGVCIWDTRENHYRYMTTLWHVNSNSTIHPQLVIGGVGHIMKSCSLEKDLLESIAIRSLGAGYMKVSVINNAVSGSEL